MTNKFKLVLRRLQIKSLGLYSYINYRFNRTSQRRRSNSSGASFEKEAWAEKTSMNFETKVNSVSKFEHYIKYMSNWRKAAYTSIVLLSLLILATLCPISFKAIDNLAEAAPSYTGPTTLTFTSARSTASVTLEVNSTAGSFATSNNNEMASFSVTTTNATGYTLNIKTSGTDYKLGNTINTLSSTKTASTFELNKWGLLPSKYNSADNTANYYPASNTGFTMNVTECANGVGNCTNASDSYTIGIGIKADYTIPAGTYTNATLIAEYVANPASYAIYYDGNTGESTDTASNMPNNQIGTSPSISQTYVELSSTTPTRTAYNFIGWCDGTVTTTNNVDSCTGTTYSAGANFYFNANTSNTTTLKAMWSIKTYTCSKQYRLENADGTLGSYVADSSETISYGGSCSYTKTVTDYKGSSSGSNGVEGTTSASNIIADTTLSLDFYRNTYALTVNRNATYISSVSGAGTYRWGQSVSISATASSGNEFTSWSQTAGTTSSFGSTTSASTTFTMPKSAATIYANGEKSKLYMWNATSANCGTTMYDNRDGTERTYTTAKIGSLCWMTKNLALGASTKVTLTTSNTNISSNYELPASSKSGFSSNTAQNVYNAGNKTCSSGSSGACYGYYTYAAATAGTNPSSGAASSDICPAGWRLPTKAEYDTLKSTYTTGATLTKSPFLGVYAGYYYSSAFYNGGSYVGYWSSTAYDSNSAYSLFFYSSSANIDSDNKRLGFSVRCVAKS